MDVSLEDLVLAYRHAKRAIFFERRGTGLLEFATYERRLHENLTRLQNALSTGGWFDALPTRPAGRLWLMPKGVEAADTPTVTRIGPHQHAAKQEVDVRVLFSPSVDFAVCEVLYIWNFGALLDDTVPQTSVANRLERAPRTGPRLFQPWQREYKRFREAPLAFARSLLSRQRSRRHCRIVSLDLVSFFDNIDGNFLLSPQFLDGLLATQPSAKLENFTAATRTLLRFHAQYQSRVGRIVGENVTRGIPIGALTSRVIANVALAPLDLHILARPDVRHYMRYVDDLVIVAEPEDASHSSSLHKLLGNYLPLVPPPRRPTTRSARTIVQLDVQSLHRARSHFLINEKKARVYELSGDEGLDFVDAVAFDLARVASEVRTFWDPETLVGSRLATQARAREGTQPRRVLREEDQTKLANYELASTLASVRSCVANLASEQAIRVSSHLLKPIAAMLEDPLRWTERADLFQDALQIALVGSDWETAQRLATLTDAAWGTVLALTAHVASLRWNGLRTSRVAAYEALRNYLHRKRLEAVLAAVGIVFPAESAFELTYRERKVSLEQLRLGAKMFAAADLRLLDREDDANRDDVVEAEHATLEQELRPTELGERLEVLSRFLAWRMTERDYAWGKSALSVFIGTRPPSYYDVAARYCCAPSFGRELDVLTQVRETVNAARGTRYAVDMGSLSAVDGFATFAAVQGEAAQADFVRVIVANLHLEERYWHAATQGSPELSLDRYTDLAKVLEHADAAARRSPRRIPSLVVLPELAVPRRWMRSVARYLARWRPFSLVTGLEYLVRDSLVRNEARGLFLAPYMAMLPISWFKAHAADGERRSLAEVGLSFDPVARTTPKVVLESVYGRLTTLICSEMLEPRLPAAVVGQVELVVAPTWNVDVASYDHLVQSVSLQAHAFVAISNNSAYSDSRIWGPLAKRHEMNVCRLVHRTENTVVWADLPLHRLRRFHEDGPDSPEAEHWKPLPPTYSS